MIKARPVAGDLAAGEAFLAELTPYIWRKYLDYAAIADIHSIKRQIHDHRGHGEIAVAGHNVKLGRGGIREIEFFVQTQQLIAGGRDPELRGRRTLDDAGGARRRAAGSTLAQRDDLTRAYSCLRRVEHCLQMVADEQTHTLPEDERGLVVRSRGCPAPRRRDGPSARRCWRRCATVAASATRELFEAAPSLTSAAAAASSSPATTTTPTRSRRCRARLSPSRTT